MLQDNVKSQIIKMVFYFLYDQKLVTQRKVFPHKCYIPLREKSPNTPYLSVCSPNTGKQGPEITPYFDTFHAVPESSEQLL